MKRTKINEKEAGIGPFLKKTRTKPKINDGLVVVAQLTTWSLLIPEDPGLNPQCVVNLGVLF